MGRFEIAKNAFKTPLEIFQTPKKSPIKSFGFEGLPDFGEQPKKSKLKTYYCPAGTVRRVGIVFKDPAHLFIGAKVHFSGSYFLCKKGDDRRDHLCCTTGAPSMRMACVLAIFDQNENYTVMPWVFGKRVYQQLNELNNIAPLQYNDFMLKKNRVEERYIPWEVYACHGTAVSLWQSKYEENVLRLAEPNFNNLKSYLGQDLSDTEIRELINQPERRAESFNNSYRRQRSVQPQTNVPVNRVQMPDPRADRIGTRFGILPEGTVSSSAINARDSEGRVDLDRVLNSLDQEENP